MTFSEPSLGSLTPPGNGFRAKLCPFFFEAFLLLLKGKIMPNFLQSLLMAFERQNYAQFSSKHSYGLMALEGQNYAQFCSKHSYVF